MSWTLFYKDGTEVKVSFQVDKNELLATGDYSEEKPVKKTESKPKRAPSKTVDSVDN